MQQHWQALRGEAREREGERMCACALAILRRIRRRDRVLVGRIGGLLLRRSVASRRTAVVHLFGLEKDVYSTHDER